MDDINYGGSVMNTKKFTKGQIVSFMEDGKRCTGRVLKGGKKPEVSFSFDMAFKIPPHQLDEASSPTPDPELAEWDVVKMTETGEGRNGPMFNAIVARNGVEVFEAECRGDGGCLFYHPVKTGTRQDVSDWQKALSQYVEAKGQATAIPDELWPEYAWEMKPTGMTYADYLRRLSEM